MKNKRRILIITPSFPIPETGAEQMDRADGIRQFVRLGYEVAVITKLKASIDAKEVARIGETIGARVVGVPYTYSNRTLSVTERLWKFVGKFRHPLYFDGAAYEYSEPDIQAALQHELATFKPDLVWFEYTYLWPLYSTVQKAGIPIITRSINFEPKHFLEEDGYTFLNYLKYIPKLLGERKTVRDSTVVLAITPNEEKIYSSITNSTVRTLPLRGLPRYTILPRPEIRTRVPLHLFFMGSSYNVSHNKTALQTILEDIAPEIHRLAPDEFIFHVLGSKVPAYLEPLFDGVTTIYEGPKYGEELDTFIQGMDIALIPSLMGAGQQQKVFEPITRGVPTITSPRAIAGYSFAPGVHYGAAHTAQEFVEQILVFRDPNLRKRISEAGSHESAGLFAQPVLDIVIADACAAAFSDL